VLAADEFAAWFRLLETPGVSRAAARRLLAACGSPQAALAAGARLHCELAGALAADALSRSAPEVDERLAIAQRWLAGGPDRLALAVGDPNYPEALLQTADPPLMLYLRGSVDWLSKRSVAVVGSRHPTAQGLENARAFAGALAEQGLVVVSGLALGVDGAAHEGALAQGGATVAVVGTGLDSVYPPRHRALADRIAAQGALVSEFPPGMPALPGNFPQRNRIIAGLSLGTLVVEAALPSGSLITARMASEAGREVFAIPGSIHAAQSKGCHALLKQGAKLVESAQDILEELGGGLRQAALPASAPAAAQDPLIEALGHDPVTLDALTARTGWSAAELSARLLDLELQGLVARLPGGLYQTLHRS
jgi:DNA processing protein